VLLNLKQTNTSILCCKLFKLQTSIILSIEIDYRMMYGYICVSVLSIV